MSQFKPNSNIFVKTVADDMAEIGLVTLSSKGMSDCLAEEVDYNVYILLSHGPMTLKELLASVKAIINVSGAALMSQVLFSIQRLNNDKQRICKDNNMFHIVY